MSDIRLQRNASNGKFGFSWGSTNDVEFTDSEEHAVMACLVEARGKWWADTDGTHGSRLDEIKNITARTRSDAEAYAREALQKLIDAKRITLHRVLTDTPLKGQAGRVVVAVYWSSRGGPEQMTKVYF